VRVLDRFLYRTRSLERMKNASLLTVRTGDIRDAGLLEPLLDGADAIVNLAAIVGDEACRVNPEATRAINVDAVRRLARVARRNGVGRIIHMSTCSTYGRNGHDHLDERSPLAPLSLYAESKVESESALLEETSRGREPAVCILRLSTLFGYSRRPRFDLVVNTLTGHAWKHGRIRIFGGKQWRPLLHVSDAARAVHTALEAPADLVAGRVFNAGGDDLNLRIIDIGRTVSETLPGTSVEIEETVQDHRDYRVDFASIRDTLGFVPRYGVVQGVRELVHALGTEEGLDPENPIHSNFLWLSRNRELLESAPEAVAATR
jgi:nucleoside-diphosphate-sugar epimerase